MTAVTHEAHFTELKTLLIEENGRLRDGLVQEAAGLVERKAELMAALQSAHGEDDPALYSKDARADIAAIKGLAEENALLLTAIRNGLKGLLTRMSNNPDQVMVGSYGSDGRPLSFSRAIGLYSASV